jgi:integrase
MRRGQVWRRCTKCGKRVDGKARDGTPRSEQHAQRCDGERTSWAYTVDIGAGAERKQRAKSGYRTKSEAIEALNALQADVAKGTNVKPSKQTVAEFLRDEWLPWLASQVEPTTHTMYELHARRYLIPRLGGVRLQQLDAPQLNAVYGWQATELGLAASTIQKTQATAHRALRDALKWGRVPRNAADDADPPAVSTPEMTTWTGEQVRGFLASLEDDRLHALWHLLFMTGLRRGEALGLRWADVDLDGATLQVRQTLLETKGGLGIGKPKTKRARRQVALDAGTVEALRSWAGIQTLERAAWDEAWVDTGLAFTREDGTALTPGQVSRQFDRRVRASGLPRIRLHDARHTHATLALQAGVHPKVVSERLGHASIAITLDTYSHAVPAMQAEAAEQIAAVVGKGGEPATT